jgi:hypothetical protein
METPKPLLQNLGAKLRQMMAEDWRGEDERNTLGMAGYWLEKLGEDETACSAYEQAFECWCFLGGRGTLVPESRTQFEKGLPIQVEPQDLIAFFEQNAGTMTPSGEQRILDTKRS